MATSWTSIEWHESDPQGPGGFILEELQVIFGCRCTRPFLGELQDLLRVLLHLLGLADLHHIRLDEILELLRNDDDPLPPLMYELRLRATY